MLSFGISSFDADPDRVTEILGLAPTSIGRKGEISRSGRKRTFNGWWLDAHEERLTGGREHYHALNELLSALQGREQRLAELRQTLNPEMIGIYGGLYHRPNQQCGIWLEIEQMRQLATLGIGWGLDIFEGDEES